MIRPKVDCPKLKEWDRKMELRAHLYAYSKRVDGSFDKALLALVSANQYLHGSPTSSILVSQIMRSKFSW